LLSIVTKTLKGGNIKTYNKDKPNINTISTKVNDEIYEAVKLHVGNSWMTKSEWLRMVVEQYINK